MSDFLSNFSGDNYSKTRQEKLYDKKKKSKPVAKSSTEAEESLITEEQPVAKKPIVVKKKKVKRQVGDVPYGPVNVIPDEVFEKKIQKRKAMANEEDYLSPSTDGNHNLFDEENLIGDEKQQEEQYEDQYQDFYSTEDFEPVEEPVTETPDLVELDSSSESTRDEEFIETDPTYQKKKRRKYIIIGILSAIVVGVLFFTYYQMTHVSVPNFKGKELADARSWTTENDVKLKVEQKYDFKAETNVILKQSITKGKIKKGTELVVEASLGPDPKEVIPLPDFKKMKLKDAKKWISENKADNLAIIEEYSETIAASDFIKFEMTTKDVKAENYKRKDKGKVYFSKGKEVYEKDITVPDFAGKAKEEAVEWTKKNEIQLKTEEEDSNTVEIGKIISQSVAKDQKMAKKETITIKVSKGKALSIPDFSQYTLQEAEAKAEGLQVQVKQTFNDTVPYGRFIGQSIEAGTKYSEKGEKPSLLVTYSAGKPFLKDLKDTTLEGDLQKIFYEDYQSKGANITYQVYYVDSSVTKGTVVQMSKYNEFVPIDYVVQIGISRGNIQPTEPDKQPSEPE